MWSFKFEGEKKQTAEKTKREMQTDNTQVQNLKETTTNKHYFPQMHTRSRKV